jgi:uncharacterized membrane protein YidH (DUF202 family)
MDDQNRYEEVPQKENAFKKILKTLGKYFKEVWLNFLEGFRYNNMKLPAILVAIPGIFIGFFLGLHSEVVTYIDYALDAQRTEFYVFSFDFSAMCLFILMLAGILNIFSALQMSGKKNLSSVIKALIGTTIIVVAGILYLIAVFVYMNMINSGVKELESDYSFGAVWWVSIISIIVSMVVSVAGVVLGFIRYDRTYEKVDR